MKTIATSIRNKWINWLKINIDLSPNNQDELLDSLRQAHKKNIIDAGVLGMMEGVVRVDNLQVRDVMIPRSRMQFLHINDDYHSILYKVSETGHSRYPVFNDDRDDVDGILLVKDLLKFVGREDEFNIKDVIRPAFNVPESTKLDNLLTKFRNKRNHIALVINEYSGTAGLITIEDVLEQIVGDIDDEHDDIDDHAKDIIAHADNHYMVKADTEMKFFNKFFGCQLIEGKFDTIGGVITHEFGHIPKSGEELQFGHFDFHVKSSDARRIILLQVIKTEKYN
ncbi:MAG: CBS domain-containing protein [Cocleimonas sp.]|nr:CBS domain-containing protein [Cocleimonas sp.]